MIRLHPSIKKRVLAIALVMLSLFLNISQPIRVSFASENEGNKEHNEEDGKIIEDYDWRREGMENGIYPIDTLEYIGKTYMGESIRAILAMSEDEELPEWNLKEFFKYTIFGDLSLDDLRGMLEDGVTLKDYALKYKMISTFSMLNNTGTLIMNNTPYDENFKITYTDRKGNNRTLTHNGVIFNNDIRTGGINLPVFCAQMGKAASTGLVYREYSDPSDIGLGNPAVLALKRAAYWYDQKNSDLTFVAAQVYVWAVINGAEVDDTSILEATFKQLGLSNDKIQTRVNFFENNVITTVTNSSYSGVKLRYWMSPSESQQNFVSYEVTEIQREYGRIAVKKMASGNNEALQGVRFRIYEDSDCTDYVTNIITDSDGSGQSIKLVVGTYYVKENSNYVPKGYVPDDKVYKVTVTKDGVTYVNNGTSGNNFYNDPWEGYLQINKRNSIDPNEILTGATFQLQEYDKDLGDYKPVGQLTGSGGVYNTGKLVYTQSNIGWFQVVEINAPTGFVNSGTIVKFNISADKKITLNSNNVEYTASSSNPTTVDVGNKPFEAHVNAIKKDSITGERLTGAVFGLFEFNATSGSYNFVRNLTDNSNGSYGTGVIYYTTANLGRYRISELQAPSGYKKAGGDGDLTITADCQVTVDGTNYTASATQPYERDFLNVPIWVRLKVDKVDKETGNRLSGTTFSIYRYNKTTGGYEANTPYAPATIRFTEQSDGTYLSDPVYFNRQNEGKFCVEEATARRGYFGDFEGHDGYKATGSLIRYYFTMREEHNEQTLNVSKSGIDMPGTFPNDPTKGELVVSKIDREAEAYVGRHGDATLEGAVYGLYANEPIVHPDGHAGTIYQKDELVQAGTIKDGTFTMKNLYLGAYYLKEITPPEGYTQDETLYPVVFTYEDQTQKVILNRNTVVEQVKKQAFELIKISEDGEQTEVDLVEGAGFSIYLISDIERILANKGVEVPFQRNSSGGYDKNDLIAFFSELDKYGLQIKDIPTATLYKKESDTWTEGEKKWLEKASGNLYRIKEMVTDYKGHIVSPELPYGEYVVVETTQVDELALVDPFLVSVREDSRTSQTWRIFDDRPFTAYLRIVKKDADTGKTVLKANTTYQIYLVETDEKGKEKETLVKQTVSNGNQYVTHESFTTDAKGVVQTYKPLAVGTYRVYETEAPEGYFNRRNCIEVKISSHTAYQTEVVDDNSFTIILTDYDNKETKGLLNLRKTGEALTGYRSGKGIGKAIDWIKERLGMDVEYEFVYESLPLAGAVYEVYAYGDVATQDNQVDQNGKNTVWFSDNELVARITTGEDGRIATLDYSILGGTPYEHMVSLQTREGKDGGVEVDGLSLPLGSYQIKEAKSPFGYYCDKTSYPVTFTWDNQNEEVVINTNEETKTGDGHLSFKNLRVKAATGVKKTDAENGQTVEGVVYGIYTADDVYDVDGKRIVDEGTLLATAVTDEGGVAEFNVDLPYRYKEYVEPEKQGEGDADDEEDNTEEKEDEAEDEEEEDIMSLGEDDGGDDPEDDSSAKEPIQALNSGNYRIVELSVPDGYYLDGKPNHVTFEYKDQETAVVTLSVEHKNLPTTIRIDKEGLRIDGGSKALEGATLQIIDVNSGEVQKEWVTDGKSKEVKYLAFEREYILHESSPASGYLSAKDIRFKLVETSVPYEEAEDLEDADQRFSLEVLVYDDESDGWVKSPENTIRMVDDFTKTVFFKADAQSQNAVQGATLELKDVEGNVVTSFITDEEGRITNLLEEGELKEYKPEGLTISESRRFITGLPIGRYTLHEAQAPYEDGYVTAADMEVVVEDTPEIQAFTMYDDHTKVKIYKRDLKTDKALKGATMRLYREDELVDEWVSDKKPHYMESLPVGEYRIVEAKAPKGYDLAEELTITVADTGEIQEFTVYDSPHSGDEDDGKPGRPSVATGDSSQTLLFALLAFASLSGLLGTALRIKKLRRGK